MDDNLKDKLKEVQLENEIRDLKKVKQELITHYGSNVTGIPKYIFTDNRISMLEAQLRSVKYRLNNATEENKKQSQTTEPRRKTTPIKEKKKDIEKPKHSTFTIFPKKKEAPVEENSNINLDRQELQYQNEMMRLKENNNQLLKSYGSNAISMPMYIRNANRIDMLEAQLRNVKYKINKENENKQPPKVTNKTVSSPPIFASRAGNKVYDAKYDAIDRHHNMGKLKQTLASITGQYKKMWRIVDKFEQKKISEEQAVSELNGLFR